jgi:acetylornithine deacetylase
MSELVPLLARLIAHRTHNPGGDEPALAALLGRELSARGADKVDVVEVPRDGATGAYVLARWGRPRLLVNVHLDTVPPNAGWTADPFVARRVDVADGERVVGLGASDTKGAIAAVLCALDAKRPHDTAILFSGDEELNNTCMRRIIETGALSTIERAIVCEPTSLQVGVRHRGILSFEVAARGKGGHSSRADSLPRPIAELARVAAALDDWGRSMLAVGPDGFRGMCLNIAKIDGGVAFNVVPDSALLTVSLRPPPGADLPALRATLVQIVERTAPAAQLRWLIDSPPFATRNLAAFRSLVGARADQPRDLAFWTEAALLSAAGIDAIVVGAGHIDHAHAPDEWVAVAELEKARAMFVKVFEESHGAG